MSEGGESATPATDTVELTIRCAFQTASDQTISVPIDWTIKQLKEHIHEVYPTHPAVTSQRLIYCGGCLTDERVLRQVFDDTRRVVGGPQVLHLVCPLPQGSPELRRRGNAGSSNSMPQPAAASTPTSTAPPSYESMMNSWNEYYAQANAGAANPMNQAYADYYRNYMNYWQQYQMASAAAMGAANQPYPHQIYVQNGHGMPMMPYFTGPGGQQPVNLTGPNRGAVHFNQNIQNAGNGQPQAGQQPQQAADANNGGDNGAVRRRGLEDALELFYKCIRVAFLLLAVVVYSSLERFMLVVGIIMVIFLTQFRRAQNRRAAEQLAAAQPAVNNNNAGEPVAEGNAERETEDAEQDGEGSSPNEEGAPAPNADGDVADAPPAVPPPSGLQVFAATCYSFVTSFVASLVPDHIPGPVNMN